MDSLQQKLQTFKNDLYSMSFQRPSDEDFIKLVKIEGLDDELYETLILIHSNYKAEMQMIKQNQFTSLTKMVDNQIETLTHFKLLLKDVEAAKNNKTNSLLTPKNIIIVLLAVGVFIGGIWTLFATNPEAGKQVVEVIKSIFK